LVHDERMPTQDFHRLAEAIQARTTALGWSQQDLVSHSGLSRTTIQKLWQGDGTYAPSRKTRIALEQALGWERGSVDSVLAGGDPTVRRDGTQASDVQVDDVSPPVRGSSAPAFPMRVQLALEEGQPLDYDVLEFEVGGRPMSIVAWAQTGVYDTEEDRAALREQLAMFHRLMGTIRREGDATPDAESVTDEN
jgi:transcriptional regulator with XRE-family HTH domain